MTKDPDRRYQHADEMLADLRSLSERTGPSASPKERELHGFRKGRYAVILTVAVILAAVLYLGRSYLLPAKNDAIESIAVLPLDNLSGDPDQEYFVDGMTEALIADLAKIRILKVISRTSVMRYKDTKKSLPDIARELGVDAIVEGSVMQAGGRVRITAQLIEASSDRHLWAENYERDMKDILALQSEVARAIAQEIDIKLTVPKGDKSYSTTQVDPRALEAYLRGRYHWNKREEENVRKGLEYFYEAVRIDADYAQAYAAIAEAYVILSNWGYSPPREANKLVKEFAQRALSIDDECASAYAALGLASNDIDYKWDIPEEYYRKALSLNPNYATAHQWYSHLLSALKRHDEAIDHAKLALQLDPLSAVINQSLSYAYYHARRYDEAIEQSRKCLELDKDFWSVHQIIYLSYLEKGMIPEAFESFRNGILVRVGSEEALKEFDRAYETAGLEGAINWIIRNMEEWTMTRYNKPYFMAMGYAKIGDRDQAFEWLEQAYELRSRFLITLGVEPSFDNLRSDPRFDEMLKKVGLK
jgi:TolB-like protein/Tfp pilus assembly protein PilF